MTEDLWRAPSQSGTHHLFDGDEVRSAVQTGSAEAVCGTFDRSGPFTRVVSPADQLVNLCEHCRDAISEE
jgi:hypothetical protein